MAWFLPTHHRPRNLAGVLEQINKVGCTTPGVVLVNGTGLDHEYLKVEHLLPKGWSMQFGLNNRGCCGAIAQYFLEHPLDDFYGLICDDEYVFTPGWDEKLVQAAGKWNVSNGNDRWQSEHRIHTYACFGGDLVRACGWWTLPGLWHWYFDNVWEVIAYEFQLRRWCPDVLTEHRHAHNGTAQRDRTYILGASQNKADQERFACWHFHEWPALRLKLRSLVPPQFGAVKTMTAG